MLQNEQKGCRRRSIGTKNQLLRDKTILRNCRKKKRNLTIRVINHKQESKQHGVTFLIKKETKNCRSSRHVPIIRSEHGHRSEHE